MAITVVVQNSCIYTNSPQLSIFQTRKCSVRLKPPTPPMQQYVGSRRIFLCRSTPELSLHKTALLPSVSKSKAISGLGNLVVADDLMTAPRFVRGYQVRDGLVAIFGTGAAVLYSETKT
jgi:hypothetical protein